MATNPNPNTILHKKVVFATLNNGNILSEPFKVYGPYGQGVKVTELKSGDKVVIPLTNETGEGAFFLKIHYPNTSQSNAATNRTIYFTFCRKDSSYDDGYRDYISRVPQEYVDAMKTWIDNGRAPLTSGSVRYRKLSFIAYGMETAQVKNAEGFEARFNYRRTPISTGGNAIEADAIANIDRVTTGSNSNANNNLNDTLQLTR